MGHAWLRQAILSSCLSLIYLPTYLPTYLPAEKEPYDTKAKAAKEELQAKQAAEKPAASTTPNKKEKTPKKEKFPRAIR